MLFSDEILDKFLLFRPLKEIQMIGTDKTGPGICWYFRVGQLAYYQFS